ncbi:hypothetical protein GLAREA_05203 [Glarea lozoyensis ATCC 20868]|uniref:Letm1 RBD domain-containing protein n=1 Tax=Glarea lozoyensis (strain ATCC 20868 / MF5171) TaxID=1116229 RepID=S3DDQ8_GLAL2|nr:uncharacterized protein GLAREA_05203 [Glarea lozoyensis ATCC 20868]EPE35865.1 hypothetical protein GLAREA_05203 [Glarea lozoyensis ATCC 20868]
MTKLTPNGLRTVSSFQRVYSPSNYTSLLQFQAQYRHASSTSTNTTSKETNRSTLNGPLSTHPAPLVLPTRKEYPSTFKYLFNLGKTYANFYKTGGKNIYHNYRATQPIKSKINAHYPPSRHDPAVALRSYLHSQGLTRAEFQLLIRSWHDTKRVPLFGLVFLICGEFTPLVVLAISNIVPWTCRIPRQIEKDRRVLEERRGISFRNLTMAPPTEKGGALVRMQLIHVSWSLGLSSSVWDYLGGQYPGLPDWMLRRRVKRRVEYLEMDDMLLRKGKVEELDVEEARMACVERGINVVGRPERDIRGDLEAWLKAKEKGAPIERLLLSRPNVWPSTAKHT